MIPLAAFAIAAGCLPLDAPNDQITAADLARSLPAWSAVAPDAPVALAPFPGAVRVLRIAELRRLASRFGVSPDDAADVCFQRPVAPIPPDRMLGVMRAALPGAHIEILEPSRMPAPAGELAFPLAGLRQGYWYGFVAYGAGHRFVVWARVDVRVPVKHIVASADLKPGHPIAAAQLRIEIREEFPAPNLRDAGRDRGRGESPEESHAALEHLAGWIPRRGIAAGTVVRKEWLDAPRLIQRGDVVKVEVVSGAARLEVQGIAEASGALGEVIPVQNPDSKRRFRARVDSVGRVSVKGSL